MKKPNRRQASDERASISQATVPSPPSPQIDATLNYPTTLPLTGTAGESLPSLPVNPFKFQCNNLKHKHVNQFSPSVLLMPQQHHGPPHSSMPYSDKQRHKANPLKRTHSYMSLSLTPQKNKCNPDHPLLSKQTPLHTKMMHTTTPTITQSHISLHQAHHNPTTVITKPEQDSPPPTTSDTTTQPHIPTIEQLIDALPKNDIHIKTLIQ